jgi:hypothetical protein
VATVQLGTLTNAILKRSVNPKVQNAFGRALTQFDRTRQVPGRQQSDGGKLTSRDLLLRHSVYSPSADCVLVHDMGDGQYG